MAIKRAPTGHSMHDAIIKARHYCSSQERCVSEIEIKLKQWGVKKEDFNLILEQLIADDFLNEARYVDTYVQSKVKLKKWGKIKIRYELKRRRVPGSLIDAGLDKIDEQSYLMILEKIILKKKAEIKETDIYKAQKKVATFAISKGYEPNLVWEAIKALFKT